MTPALRPLESTSVPQHLHQHQKAVEFETLLAHQARRSQQRAWWVAAAASVFALLALGTLLALLPLKQTVPYLVYVDKATGVTQVVDVATPTRITQDEVHARHWVTRYVQARERYVYKLLQDDYDFVMATSGPDQQKEFSRLYEPGPAKKDALLRDRVEERIQIISPQLTPGQTGRASIRFRKETWRTGNREPEKVEVFVADLAFDWASVRGWDAQALLVNPLGFRVNAYRVTPELPS